MWIVILVFQMRRFHDSLIFTIGIPIPEKMVLILKQYPGFLATGVRILKCISWMAPGVCVYNYHGVIWNKKLDLVMTQITKSFLPYQASVLNGNGWVNSLIQCKLFKICLEPASPDQINKSFAKLHSWNEISPVKTRINSNRTIPFNYLMEIQKYKPDQWLWNSHST